MKLEIITTRGFRTEIEIDDDLVTQGFTIGNLKKYFKDKFGSKLEIPEDQTIIFNNSENGRPINDFYLLRNLGESERRLVCIFSK